jgi:hypothetical protein
MEGPFCPLITKSRIYIDLTEPDKYAENFERLLRWIFDKPLYVRPELGDAPAFLSDGDHISLGTTVIFKRCVDAITNRKDYASGTFDEYCDLFIANLERFRISKQGEFDEQVVRSIEEFLSSRNEAIRLFVTIARYSPDQQYIQRIHRLFEQLIPYMSKPENVMQWNDADFDNFRFIVHELFLYVLAILLSHDRLDQANHLLQQQYYVPGNAQFGLDVMVTFTVFCNHIRSLEHRNQRLSLQRTSMQADLLKERCAGSGIDFRYLMQADFIAFMRSEVIAVTDNLQWWPETLIYLGHFKNPFEIFARSVSKAYFDRAKILLGIQNPNDLEPLFEKYRQGKRRLPRIGWHMLEPQPLLGYAALGTRA